MTTAAEELFVGLDRAETALPARWAKRTDRVRTTAMLAALVAVQLAWLALFVYAAYIFVST